MLFSCFLLDFGQAFETVNHEMLLKKFQIHEVREESLCLVSILSD